MYCGWGKSCTPGDPKKCCRWERIGITYNRQCNIASIHSRGYIGTKGIYIVLIRSTVRLFDLGFGAQCHTAQGRLRGAQDLGMKGQDCGIHQRI